MSLKKRPIDPFRLVFIHDDSLDALPDKLLREYADGDREWGIIEAAVKELKDPPVVFTVDPLKAAYDALAITGVVGDMKAIFAAHVRDIANVPENMRPKFVHKDDRQYLDLEYVDTWPLSWVSDIAGEIIRRGMGSVSPFTLPDLFWRARGRRHVLAHAKNVSQIALTTETASGENTPNVQP